MARTEEESIGCEGGVVATTAEPPAAPPREDAAALDLGARARPTTVLFVAWRHLTGERRRWLLSTVALGIAAMLVLFLSGTNRWVTESATAYLQHSGADVVVLQQGIEDLLFAQSALPPGALDRVRNLQGVQAVDSVTTVNDVAAVGGAHVPVYLVGYDAGHGGGPWQMRDGSPRPAPGEIVVDRGFATLASVHTGSRVQLFGHSLRVAGMSDGTNAAGDFFLFVQSPLAQQILGGTAPSYGFVHLAPGQSAAPVVAAIDRIPGVHALPLATLQQHDADMITTSFAQPIQIIVVLGFIAGVLVAGIVLYTATVEHSRDYAVLKALGAGRGVLYGSAIVQSVVLSIAGVLVGWLLAASIAWALDTWHPVVASQLDPDLVLTLTAVILAVNVLAALLPVQHIRHIDPQEVFKA